MPVGAFTRIPQWVIMTDCVMAADHRQAREWKPTHELHRFQLPIGWKESARHVLVVTDCEEHGPPLMAVGHALAVLAQVDEQDYGADADEHRRSAAVRAEIVRGHAWAELDRASRDGSLDPVVYSKMVEMLSRKGPERVEFSARWEYASILSSVMAIESLRIHELAVHQSMFGELEWSSDLRRQDRHRAREYLGKLTNGVLSKNGSAPKTYASEITSKYVQTVLPAFLVPDRMRIDVDLHSIRRVTSDELCVTGNSKKSPHDKKCGPPKADALSKAFAGFFVGSGPDGEDRG
jgi:hypothetical protein